MKRVLVLFAAGCVTVGCALEPGVDDLPDASDTDTGDDPFYADPSDLPAGADPCRGPVLVRGLLDVVDGDTVWVDLDEGPDEKIRFIGIDTPEVGYDGEDDECYASEATAFTGGALAGDRFWLTFDDDCTDDYDRTLAYVHTRDGFLQMALLAGGYADVMTVAPNDTFQAQFEEAEQEAQDDGAGMWGECP